MKILHCKLANNGIERVIYCKSLLEKHIIWVTALKNLRLPTQLIIFLDKNIKTCQPSEFFLFTCLNCMYKCVLCLAIHLSI